MLRSFRLSNHKSFLEDQELLLMPSAPARSHEVLTVAAIYGANASGKSNLIDGLRFMARAVDQSFRAWRHDRGVPRTPFQIGSLGSARPTTFVVELVIEDIRYTYGFSVDDEVVIEEWLYAYPEKRKRVLFEREGIEVRFGTTLGTMKTVLVQLGRAFTRPNALYLSLAGQLPDTPMKPVSRWLTELLGFHAGSSEILQEDLVERVAPCLGDDRLRPLLVAADTGITDVYVREVKAPTGASRELRFVHGGSLDSFGIEDESDGTRNWISLLPAVLGALDRGGTLVVDEIDASLHPMLTARLVHLFAHAETNPRHAQLIFTTHDTSLLGSYAGREQLQRDHIWFVEKDSGGRSKMYALSDFRPRKEENTEKRYLSGSYGAVPVSSEFEFEEAVIR